MVSVIDKAIKTCDSTLYFLVKSKGKTGASHSLWRKEDRFSTKSDLKNHYKGRANIIEIYTEEQLKEKYKENAENIIRRAL